MSHLLASEWVRLQAQTASALPDGVLAVSPDFEAGARPGRKWNGTQADAEHLVRSWHPQAPSSPLRSFPSAASLELDSFMSVANRISEIAQARGQELSALILLRLTQLSQIVLSDRIPSTPAPVFTQSPQFTSLFPQLYEAMRAITEKSTHELAHFPNTEDLTQDVVAITQRVYESYADFSVFALTLLLRQLESPWVWVRRNFLDYLSPTSSTEKK